jgi:uncharacterized membrane protein
MFLYGCNSQCLDELRVRSSAENSRVRASKERTVCLPGKGIAVRSAHGVGYRTKARQLVKRGTLTVRTRWPPGRQSKEKKVMRKLSTLMAATALVASGGIAVAQNQPAPNQPSQQRPATSGQSGAGQMDPNRGTGMTGAPSSSNPQAGGGYNQPRQLPENGGAPTTQTPGR